MHINFLPLPQLLKTTLRKNGVITVEHLTAHNRDDLLALMGVAELSVERIEAALMRCGLALSDDITMVQDKAGRYVRKERPLTAAQVKGYLTSPADLLREQADESETHAALCRKIAANMDRLFPTNRSF